MDEMNATNEIIDEISTASETGADTPHSESPHPETTQLDNTDVDTAEKIVVNSAGQVLDKEYIDQIIFQKLNELLENRISHVPSKMAATDKKDPFLEGLFR